MLKTWKDIPDFEGVYRISSFGDVESLDRHVFNKASGGSYILKEKALKIYKKRQYPQITLEINGLKKVYHIHRLLAILFIPNTKNYDFVNHIDGNKHNNDLSNLEWCTHSENMQHAYNKGLRTPPSEQIIVDLCSGITFQSIAQFRKCKNISRYCAWHGFKNNKFKDFIKI